jgi:hypothetical protein
MSFSTYVRVYRRRMSAHLYSVPSNPGRTYFALIRENTPLESDLVQYSSTILVGCRCGLLKICFALLCNCTSDLTLDQF